MFFPIFTIISTTLVSILLPRLFQVYKFLMIVLGSVISASKVIDIFPILIIIFSHKQLV
jgi:hypothetical protein